MVIVWQLPPICQGVTAHQRSGSDGPANEKCTFCPNGAAVVVFRGVRQGVGEIAEQVGGTVEAQLP